MKQTFKTGLPKVLPAQQVFAARDWSRDLLLELAIFHQIFFVNLNLLTLVIANIIFNQLFVNVVWLITPLRLHFGK